MSLKVDDEADAETRRPQDDPSLLAVFHDQYEERFGEKCSWANARILECFAQALIRKPHASVEAIFLTVNTDIRRPI
jgi:hypothetical protein